jgi:hypothetical protein
MILSLYTISWVIILITRVWRAVLWNENKLFFFEEDIFIQLIWNSDFYSTHSKNRFHTTDLKKLSLLNSFQKVVLIQFSRKCSSHSTYLKRSFSFNSFEKVVLIQFIWKSFSCNFVEKVVRLFSCVDYSAALIIQLRWSSSCVDHEIKLITRLNW